jgi:proteic killer suppression protein
VYTDPCTFGYIAILSFKDPGPADIYNGTSSKAARRINRQLRERISGKLDSLNAATTLNDLKSTGNELEKLTDDLEGYWSTRVNDQYRIYFRFEAGNAADVFCEDAANASNQSPFHPPRGDSAQGFHPCQWPNSGRTLAQTENLNEVIRGKRGITPETAWKLASFFETSPEYWMNLQTAYNLTLFRQQKRRVGASPRPTT